MIKTNGPYSGALLRQSSLPLFLCTGNTNNHRVPLSFLEFRVDKSLKGWSGNGIRVREGRCSAWVLDASEDGMLCVCEKGRK